MIKMTSWNSWGNSSFITNDKKYDYAGADAAILIKASRMIKNPGKALTLVKKSSKQYRKDGGEWKNIGDGDNEIIV